MIKPINKPGLYYNSPLMFDWQLKYVILFN